MPTLPSVPSTSSAVPPLPLHPPTPSQQTSPLLFDSDFGSFHIATLPPLSAGLSSYSFSSASLPASSNMRFELERLRHRYRTSQEDLRLEQEARRRESERHAAEVGLLEREIAERDAEYRRGLEEARRGSSSGGKK